MAHTVEQGMVSMYNCEACDAGDACHACESSESSEACEGTQWFHSMLPTGGHDTGTRWETKKSCNL